MKNKVLVFLVCSLFLVFCNSCDMDKCLHGSGNNTKQIYETGYFREVNARGIFEIVLVQDSIFYVELEGGDKILEYIQVRTTDSVLNLDNSNDCSYIRNYERIKCFLHYSDNLRLSLFDVCKLTNQTPITSNFSLAVPADLAEVDIEMNNSHFQFYNNGNTGGTYTFRGYSDLCEISGHYTARFILSDLISREMYINNSSTGDMHVNATEFLAVQIHNKGNVYYTGSPEIVIDSVSGTGILFSNNGD